MSNYNTSYIYNARGDRGGFLYNGAPFIFTIKLNEALSTIDGLSLYLAKIILSEQKNLVYDELIHSVLIEAVENQKVLDDSKYSTLFSVTDQIGITDSIAELIVFSYIYDNLEIIDKISELSNILNLNDSVNIEDITNFEALFTILDKFGMEDIYFSLVNLINIYEQLGVTDRAPKTAISDFIIGVRDQLDSAYDWLIPFNLKIDWNSTNIQVAPQAEVTSIEMPGIDGDIVEDTVYKTRLFEIVGYSEQGLTIQEKEELKSHIVEVLDSTKHKSKNLTIQSSGITFESKYEGLATIQDGPSWVKASIPVRISPYGQKTFAETIEGSGLVDNSEGAAPLGVVHTITGPITNPSFTFGDVTVAYNGTIPANNTLTINHNMYTVYITDSNGKKTNALNKFNGGFYKVPKGVGAIINANSAVASHLLTEYSTKVLW